MRGSSTEVDGGGGLGEPTPTSSPRGRCVSYRRPLLLLLVLVLPCYPTSSLSFSVFPAVPFARHHLSSFNLSVSLSLSLSLAYFFSRLASRCRIFLRKIDKPHLTAFLPAAFLSLYSLSSPPVPLSVLPSFLSFFLFLADSFFRRFLLSSFGSSISSAFRPFLLSTAFAHVSAFYRQTWRRFSSSCPDNK